ncbi:unnamed protein product [Durusdinium trenchii]|uniref:Uncharacterized protein n=1 Tax=Durusdinium trenchii TaxID=1381693 RepID=A0ABP0QEW2_9DINO
MPSFQGRQICLLALPVGDLKINDVSDGHIIREVRHGAEDVRKAGNFSCKAKVIVVEGPIKQDWILARMDLQKAVEEVMHLDRQTVKNLAENAKKGMDSFHGDQKLREAVKRLEGHLRSRTTKMPPYPQAGALYIPTDDGESPFQERLDLSWKVYKTTVAFALPDSTHERGLLQQMEDLEIEKALLEKRAMRELQDLESLVKHLEEERRRKAAKQAENRLAPKPTAREESEVAGDWQGAAPPRCQLGEDDLPPVVPVAVQSAWFAAQKVEFHDISSDGEEQETHQPPETDDVQYPAGLHYVQRVAELEAQSDELKLRLEELHASESAMRRESQEKNDLITVLLQKAKLPNSETGLGLWGDLCTRRFSGEQTAKEAIAIRLEVCGETAKQLPKRKLKSLRGL